MTSDSLSSSSSALLPFSPGPGEPGDEEGADVAAGAEASCVAGGLADEEEEGMVEFDEASILEGGRLFQLSRVRVFKQSSVDKGLVCQIRTMLYSIDYIQEHR